jgi:transposase
MTLSALKLVPMAKASEWAKRVADWRASGQTAAEFSEAQGYPVASLRYWSSKLGQGKATGSGRRQAPVVQLARVTQAVVRELPLRAAHMIIDVDGARLTVCGEVDAVSLRAAVAAMRCQSKETA